MMAMADRMADATPPQTGLALIGSSWKRAYSLLDGTPRGGVRTHLLRLLHGGSLEAALAIDPLPVRCWQSAARTNSVTLDDLIREYSKPGKTKQHVRPATIGYIPHVQTFCCRLYEVNFYDNENDYYNAQIKKEMEALLSIPWQCLIEEKLPFLVGLDDCSVVVLVVGQEEKAVIFLFDPWSEVAFIPVLLEGLVKVMLSDGARTLKVWVHQANQGFFEEAGWRSSEAEAKSGQVCMEYSLPVADTP